MPPDICLIEDDPIMGESLSERLVLEGFGVDWCTSGGQALGRLQQKNMTLWYPISVCQTSPVMICFVVY